MANNQGRINFGIGFNVDKTGLNELRSQLQALQNLTIGDLGIVKNVKQAKIELESIKSTAKIVENALEQSFNKDLGTTNLTKFNQTLKESGTNLTTVINKFNGAGAAGKKMANTLTADLLTTNKHMRETSQWLDKMANTMANTVRWSIASAALNSMTGSIQKAYSFTKQLDTSLNDIMIVTDKSAEDMARFAKQANNAAKSLGSVTTDYTKASLIYYQQGLSDQEVAARTETTMKVANVTGQSAETVSEQLTAVWNGYKVSSQEAELYIDKLSAVAATTAADLEELSTGMSKVASAANIMGVNIDQLNAQLATIVSVTREAPESIGTALKTIYARMSDIEAGLDTETTLGEYTAQMAEMGVNALDANGNLRDMGDVVEEIGGKWNTLNRNQQTALAQTIAGTRQYSRMMALFDNWDMYQQAKSTSTGAAGTLQAQNEEYMESMEAHLNRLQTEAEELYSTLFNAEDLKPLINGLTSIVGLVENIVEGLGGGKGLLGVLGTIGLNVFSDKITSGVSKGIRNIKGEIEALNEEKAQARMIEELSTSGVETEKLKETTIEEIVSMKQEQLKVEKYLTEEQKKQANDLLKQKAKLENDKIDLEERQKKANKLAGNLLPETTLNKNLSGKQMALELEKVTGEITDVRVFKDAFQSVESFITDSLKTEEALNRSAGGHKSQVTIHEKIYREEGQTDADESLEFLQQEQAIIEAQKEAARKKEEAAQQEKESRANRIQQLIKDEETGLESLSHQGELLLQTGVFSPEAEDRLQEIVKLTETLGEKSVDAFNDDDLQALSDAYRDIALYGEEAKQATKDAIDTFANSADKAAELEAALRDVEASNKKLINSFDIEVAVQSFTNLAGATSQVVTGFQQLASIGEIWSDEDLTGGEKLLQTITSLSFGLPMLINGLSSAKIAFTGIITSIKAFSASTMMSAATSVIEAKAFEASSDASKENAFWKTILAAASDELTDEQRESIAMTLAENKALDENTKELLKNLTARKLADGAEVDGTKLDAGKLLKDKIGGSIKNILAKAAPGLIISAFVAVAAAAVAGAYTFIDNWHKKEQKALIETKKLAQEAAESTQLLKESYDQLSSSIDKYKEASTSIDDMVVGTQEYKDAIHEANDELLAMIRQYPELSAQIEESTEHTGLLVLKTENALENLLKLESNKVSRAQAVEYGLQAQTLQAEQDLAISQQARKIKTQGQGRTELGTSVAISPLFTAAGAAGLGAAGAGITTAIAGTKVGAALGTAVLPVVGTIVGAIVGLAAGAIVTVATTSENIQSSNEDLITRTAKLYNENNALFSGTKDEVKHMLSQELDLNDDELLESLYNNQEAIKDLSANIKALNLAEDQHRTQQAEQYLSSMGINHQYQTNVAKELKLSEEDTAKYLEQANQMTDAEVHKYFAEKKGWTYIKNKSGKGEFEYIDANGEVQNKIIDDKTLRAQVAEMLALEQEIGTQAHKVINAIDKVAKTGVKAVDDQLANVVTQQTVQLENLTESERKIFTSALENLSLLSADELNALGINSINILEDYANESLASLDEFLSKLSEKYITNPDRKAQYDRLFEEGEIFANSDLSYSNREILAQFYGSLDDAALSAFTSIISSLGENADDFVKLLPSLSADGIDTFKESLAVESEFSSLLLDPIFSTFIFGVKDAFDLYGQFNKASHQENVAFLESVSNKLHNIGDTISADVYAELSAELKTFFTETSTGLYALTEQAEKFHKIAKEDPLNENKEKYDKERDRLEKLEGDFDAIDKKEKKYNNLITEYSEVFKLITSQQISLADIYNSEGYAYEKIPKNLNWAHQTLALLSSNSLPGQKEGKTYIDILRDNDVDVDYWYDQIVNKGQFDYQMLTDLETALQQYYDQLTAEINNAKSETSTQEQTNKINKSKEQLKALEESFARDAGSLSKFEELIAEGYIRDKAIIEKYTNYWKEIIPQEFAASVDYSFQLKDSEKAIESLVKKLQKYEDAYNSAFGDSKIEILKAQSSTLEDLNNQYLEQIEILQARAELYKNNTLSSSLATAGLTLGDLRFDKNGQIMNYGLIGQQAEGYFKTVENGEELFNNFINTLNNYVAYINQIEDNLDLINENKIKELDIRLNIELDKNNSIREWNNFIKEWKGTKIEAEIIPIKPEAADDAWNYWVQQAQENLDSIFADKTGDLALLQAELADIDNQDLDAITAFNRKEEKRNQINQKLLESKQYLLELEESHISALNEINSVYQEQIDYLDNIYNYYKQNLELSKLLNGENKNWINESSFYTKATESQISGEKIARQQLIDNQERLQAFISKAKTEEEYSTEEFRTLATNFQESLSSWQNSISKAIEAVKEEYLATIDNIFYRFEQRLTNGKGLDAIKDEFDWTKDMRDKYLDDVNREFGISSFSRNVDKEINVNTSISAQQRLNKLREEELETLRSKDKLTQYDLDRANKRLDILKAQIALEDAQQDKSQMRLVRGADGSYGYQYVADANKIAEAEETLAKAQNELYNMDVDEYEANLDRMFQLYEEYRERMIELANDEDGLTEEDIASLQRYTDEIQQVAEASNLISENLEQETELLGSGIAIMSKLINENGFTNLFSEFQTQLIGEDGLTKTFTDSMDSLQQAWDGLVNSIDTTLLGTDAPSLNSLLKIDWKTRQEEANNYVANITDVIAKGWENAALAVSNYQTAVDNALTLESEEKRVAKKEILEDSEYQEGHYFYSSGSIRTSNAQLILRNKYRAYGYETALNTAEKLDTIEGSNRYTDYLEWFKSAYDLVDKLKNSGWPGAHYIKYNVEPNGQITIDTETNDLNIVREDDRTGAVSETIDKIIKEIELHNQSMPSFDTGGYTGEWGATGRLAMLHEKELVLNKEDTRNILDAVSIMRNISTALDTSMMSRLVDMFGSLTASFETHDVDKEMIIEQHVNIDATFPNVNVAAEVEEAFSNIIDIAAQRATKNSRG